MYGWHRSTSGRSCKLEDLRYLERHELPNSVDDEPDTYWFVEQTYFVDQYGGKQRFDTEAVTVADNIDREFMPYYICDSCQRYQRSWEEAKVHVGLDDAEGECR